MLFYKKCGKSMKRPTPLLARVLSDSQTSILPFKITSTQKITCYQGTLVRVESKGGETWFRSVPVPNVGS